MKLPRWVPLVLLIPFSASLLADKKREEQSYDQDKQDTDLLQQMIRDFPCEEGDGVWYEIQDENGVKKMCVSFPRQVTI